MAKFVLDFGQTVDMLTKDELDQSLEDARIRGLIAGIKLGEMWLNAGTPGMGTTFYTSTGAVPQCPAAGFVWAIMNMGVELNAAANLRIHKSAQPQSSTLTGFGRPVATTTGSQALQNVSFAKGQFTLRTSDVFTLTTVAGTSNFLSVFLAYIEVPAERIGELLI